MGRFLRKCNGGVGEIAVVGVRTRARAALAMAAVSSETPSQGRRRVRSSKVRSVAELKASTTPYHVHHELRSRRRVAMPAPENSASARCQRPEITSSSSVSDVVFVVEEDAAANCSGSEISSDFPTPCCSSNNASTSRELIKDRLEIADPEVESAETSSRCFDCSKAEARTESKLREAESPDDLDSTATIQDAKSTVQIKMPSDSEIEEFFSAAEKDLQKRFTEKYNFDVVKDVPLEGRYEWVPVKANE